MLTLLGTKLYEKVTVKEEEVFSLKDYHDIAEIVPLNDILSFYVNEEDRDITSIPLDKESIILIGLNFDYNLRRVIVHTDDRVHERIYVEIIDTNAGEEISMNVAVPEELKKGVEYHTVILQGGSCILLDYKEYNLHNYTLVFENQQTVNCKGFMLRPFEGFDTVHDFTDRYSDILISERLN